MSKTLMARADFFTSIFFFILGIYMAFEGLRMPGAGQVIEPGGEPGRVPVMLGCIISFFAAVLLIRSIGQGGHRRWVGDDDGGVRRIGALRCAYTAIGCSLYAVGLVGSTILGWQVPYYFATCLFVFLFITAFEWEYALEYGGKRWQWLNRKFPAIAGFLQSAFGFLSSVKAPYVWLIVSALIQAVLVTWAITYVFEQELYVKLP